MPALSREELHRMVWAEPMRTLAPRFDLSDTGLKKICVKLAIPVPQRGYWAKLQAGKKVSVTPLAPRGPGMAATWEYGPSKPWRWPIDPEAELAEPVPERPEFPEPIEIVEARIRKALGKVQARPLMPPHPAIAALLNKDEKRRAKQQAGGYVFSWEEPQFDSGFEQRRLRILNSLFLGLAKAGASGWTADATARDLGVTVGGRRVSISLDHPAAKKNQHGQYQVRKGPADILRFQVLGGHAGSGRTSTWSEDKGQKLEACLTEIAVEVMVAGELQYRQGRLESYERALKHRAEMEAELVKRRAEAERQARETREAEERQRREMLLAQGRAWRETADLRAFIAAVEEKAPASRQLASWVSWARAEADRLDPLLHFEVPDSQDALDPLECAESWKSTKAR